MSIQGKEGKDGMRWGGMDPSAPVIGEGQKMGDPARGDMDAWMKNCETFGSFILLHFGCQGNSAISLN